MVVARAIWLTLFVLGLPWHFGLSENLVSCDLPPVKCFAAPCSEVPAELCRTGEQCLACGCTPVCAPAGANVQYPLHRCSNGSLALTCEGLANVQPGDKCAVVDCRPGYICKEYFCGSDCQVQCVPSSDSSTDPPEAEYICPDGSPTTQCDVPPGADSCGIPCNKRGDTVCGHFLCGSPPVCGPVCARKRKAQPDPTPNPAEYACPDGTATYKCEPPQGTTDCPIMCDTEADTLCGHFMCGNPAKCSPVCAKRKRAGMPPLPPPPPYTCPDGKPAHKCELPPNSNMTCRDMSCTEVAGMMCANLNCGEPQTCAPVCFKDPYYQEPEPSPYICPDNKTQALMCSTGTDYWNECGDCQNKEGFVCSEFKCGANGPCNVMCLPDPYYKPYLCPNNQPGKKCDPSMEQAPDCNPKCTDLGTFCAALECNGVCSYTCIQDPGFEPPDATCPVATPQAGKPGKACKEAAVTTGQTCSTLGQTCAEGMMCRHLDCGASCSAYCVADPYYSPPQPSEYLCPADNSTALLCSSYKDVFGDPDCASMKCVDGTFCGSFQCGGGQCKAMCVKDPWYRPYICPGTQAVAKWCDLPPDKPITCPDCAAKGPGYFCAPFDCGGACAPVCMKDPWFQPLPYICDNGASAQQCPGDTGAECAATTCPEGHVCGNFDCSGTSPLPPAPVEKCTGTRPDGTRRCFRSGSATGGTVLASTAGRLGWSGSTTSASPGTLSRLGSTGIARPGASLTKRDAEQCKVQCVQDPWWSPARPYTCADGSAANECGPMSTEPVCTPACTAAGTFCMNTACGDSSTCSPQCVTDPYYQPPPLICPDNNFLADVCKKQPSPSECAALQCEDQGMTCAVAKCGEEDACNTRCVFEGYMYPWRPPAYTCGDADNTIATFCDYKAQPGEATCEDATCPDGTYCTDMECPGADGKLVCAPKCVPYPPPSMGPPGGGGEAAPCPPGGNKPGKPCSEDPCASTTCSDNTTCVTNTCDCTAQCVKYHKGPIVVGTVEDALTGGVKRCVKGKAVDPKTCTGDKNPCKSRKCDGKRQRCVAEYCGGCHAACLPTNKCKSGNKRRACVGDANFCKAAKCKKGATCIADQCNNCAAACVGPCKPGQHASRQQARCIRCPAGHACAGDKPGPMTAAPKACNNGYFADEDNKPVVECTKCPAGTTTPNTPGVGYSTCKPKT